jgi:putative ABC transport system ATP-binding protein
MIRLFCFYERLKAYKKLEVKMMIKVSNVSKVYSLESGDFYALKNNNINIKKGEFVAIMGPSGSGKSTLLQLLGGLDLPTNGNIIVDEIQLNDLNEKELTLFRRTKIGFVFQNYQLLPMMTVGENIALPLSANNTSKSEIRSIVKQLISDVNLDGKELQFPSQLSGGQQQRVAIARALAMKPKLILADEPTGNLDQKNGEDILKLLSKLNKEEDITIVMVTHDLQAAQVADRIITVRDGFIVADGKKGGTRREEMANSMA